MPRPRLPSNWSNLATTPPLHIQKLGNVLLDQNQCQYEAMEPPVRQRYQSLSGRTGMQQQQLVHLSLSLDASLSSSQSVANYETRTYRTSYVD